MEELRAEIALLQVKLRRQDHMGDTGSMSGVGSTPPTSVGVTAVRESRLRCDAPPFASTTGLISTSPPPLPPGSEVPMTGIIPTLPDPTIAETVGAGTTLTIPRGTATGLGSPGTGPRMSLPGTSVTMTDVSLALCPRVALEASRVSPAGIGGTTGMLVAASPIASTSVGVAPLPPPAHTPGMYPTAANVLPQIHPYHGEEQKDGETFQDWVEHFKSVSRLARWGNHYKLVYVTTSLRGTAKAFYRACTPMQRSDYGLLIAELAKRFTPVRLPAIQTQVFHDRRQGPEEIVDEFAQELRQLYAKAYAPVTRGTPEAEEVGQRVLTSHFVTGLRVDIQSAVVGLEGDMDHLLMKAHFEEAKRRELAAVRTTCSIYTKEGQPE